MKAVVFHSIGDIRLEDVPEPRIQDPTDAIVRLTASAIPGGKSIFIFRMYQEMMNNIMKHSHATHVRVSVRYSNRDHLVLAIEDDGVGFDVKQKKDSSNGSSGLGLKSMRNRAKMIGADLSIQSEPQKGTLITVHVPLN